jgi:prepilin-type N-terminal cleavage/methylation domain-containing protein
MKRRNAAKGFTLLEMLAALAMAGAVMAPLYYITRGIAEQTSSKQLEVEAMQRARIAMDTLIRDFSRAGLFTSPNTAVDNRFLNGNTMGSSARYRAAVVHLNPPSAATSAAPDAVMLSGNFLGSDVYRALAISEYRLQIIGPVTHEEDCKRQFSPAFAFAHISDNSGRDLDARVEDVSYVDDVCEVEIASTDYNTQSFKTGDTILLSANQTIVYAVENGTLVRYFVAYDSPDGANSGNCGLAETVSSAEDVQVPGTVLANTRQVVANYVQDFQVWFRPVTDSNGWVVPHYESIAAVVGANADYYEDGFTPSSANVVIPLDTTTLPGNDSVTCSSLSASGNVSGPELVRSALIRLTVRSEMSDRSLRRLPDAQASRLEKHLLAADTGLTVASGDNPFAYTLRTVTTEVEMPNLTARSDLLQP